jgi:hypothetical protein
MELLQELEAMTPKELEVWLNKPRPFNPKVNVARVVLAMKA